MSSIQSRNLYLYVGFLYRLLGNGIWPVRGVRSRCGTLKSKRCYGNNNLKVKLYSLLLDIYCIYLFSVTEKNQLTLNYRSCDSFISEFIKF